MLFTDRNSLLRGKNVGDLALGHPIVQCAGTHRQTHLPINIWVDSHRYWVIKLQPSRGNVQALSGPSLPLRLAFSACRYQG